MTLNAPMKRFLLLLATSLLLEQANSKEVPTFAAADLVLGQPDFLSAAVPPAPASASLDSPSSVVVDSSTGKVFVADTGNNRVLRYANAAALQSGAAAEAVFGQADFVSNGATPVDAGSLDSPTGLWVDGGGHLWVADTDNNRVVMYANANAGTIVNGPDATLVLGQSDAAGEAAATTRIGMSAPESLCVDAGGRLWVADTANNRVLKFNDAASKATGAEADGEFGQDQVTPFTTSTGGSDNLHFMGPAGVAVDSGGTLWVADRGNNRIMGFPTAATISNGANGARILGQPDYNNGSTAAGLSSSRISGPTGLFADAAGGLWALDQGNNRALRFANIKTIDNGKPASTVVGQADFSSNVADLNARRLKTQDATAIAGLFAQPDGSLWISDLKNHRVLRFSPLDSGPPTVAISGKRKVTTPKKRLVVRGTASDDTSVTQVILQVGKKQIPALGTTVWKKTVRLKKPRTIVRAYAHDASGKISAPAKVLILRKPAP